MYVTEIDYAFTIKSIYSVLLNRIGHIVESNSKTKCKKAMY